MPTPYVYNSELASKITGLIAQGKSVRSICRMEGMPDPSTIYYWILHYPEFKELYLKAKEDQADALAEDMLDIADDGTNDWMAQRAADGSITLVADKEHIQRSRLRIDTRKWLASKLKAKKYGDSAMVKMADADGNKLIIETSIRGLPNSASEED